MAEQQLHLFDPTKPLLERFGVDFFRAVPKKPGVYIMSGEKDRVLYVGQSKNLRQRLSSYKNAKPDRVPRKIIRLVHSVRAITWQECDSPEAALLKENELLRTLRPKFNKLNTYPKAYGFIGLKRIGNQMDFWIGFEPRPEGMVYGAFKTGCMRGYATMLRLIWSALKQPQSPHELPAPLTALTPPRTYTLHIDQNPGLLEPDALAKAITNYLEGVSDELIPLLSNALPQNETLCSFQRNLQLSDLEVLSGFFERGTRRNYYLRQKYGVSGPIIPQEELDDLLVFKKYELAGSNSLENEEQLITPMSSDFASCPAPSPAP
ncbi:Excinuclease ABC C subunit domain protein [Pedosphaera parvula Ellin514]|uniref:Excinuclease ABC C subunit domain protein n=2 Tax=Pedosphaera TaxID=1032526 RepID=B9XN43_PEDPL|nr:Excinuclease ABC C subunit domain protein [Pedosphaera parvula Ellin514]